MAEKNSSTPDKKQDPIFLAIMGYHEEAYQAKRTRMDQNERNWDCYHHRQDWAHKEKGQSKEFLPKQSLSVDQITYFMQQGLVDTEGWFSVEAAPGVNVDKIAIKPDEAQKLVNRQLEKCEFAAFMADSLTSGQLGALMICKVGGRFVPEVTYRTKQETDVPNKKVKKRLIRRTKQRWQLRLTLLRQENYYPDPSGAGLYEQEIVTLDYHELVKMAEKFPKEFDMEVVKGLCSNADQLQETKKGRETNQDTHYGGQRKKIEFIEHWGTICDPCTGEVIIENGLCRITKEGHIITAPMENPLWDGESPYVVSPISRVPYSVWHKGLMDAASLLNHAQNELFNLELDGAMSAVFGVKQLREDYLEDPSEVDDGIFPGMTLKVREGAPPGAKVLERVDTGEVPASSMAMYQVLDREYQQSSMSNDFRVGNLPQRSVKATEVVASNQSLSTVFTGIVKIIELNYVAKIIRKSWLGMAQNMNDLDQAEIADLLGKERAAILASLAPEDRFAQTATGFKYHVSGLSTTMNKIQDFQKIATLLQTIGTNETLQNEFRQEFSYKKMLRKVLNSLDIDVADIKADESEIARANQDRNLMMQATMARLSGGAGGGGKRSMEEGADTGSQMQSPMAGGEESAVPIDRSGMLSGGMTRPS